MDRIWLRRIIREISTSRSRTALTVLSIAIGLFAVSLTFRTQSILSRNVLERYRETQPAAITVEIAPTDIRITKTLGHIAGVQAVEGVRHLSARALIGGTWRALALRGVEDMRGMRVNRIAPDSGAWPAPDRAILIERSYIATDVQVGDTLTFTLEGRRQYNMPIAGAVQDLAAISGRLGSPVLQGYITLNTAETLTGSRAVDELAIAVDESHRDTQQLHAIADQIRADLRQANISLISLRIRDPGVPEAYTILSAVFQTLNVLGGLSLLLSVCLVINTTSAMLTRHVPQIGIMKAIGARASTVFLTYLGMILLIALLALLVAIPSAALCAWLLAGQLAWLLNYDIRDISVPPGVLAIELIAGLITPLLASAYPIRTAARITVRAALSAAHAAAASASNALRRSSPIPGAPIALLYAARSMFRRKPRLALTLAALIFGGAIEITVISAQASLFATLDQIAEYWQQDLTVSFSQPMRTARVIDEARAVPGVTDAEPQPATLATRRRDDGGESEQRYAIFGVQPGSPLIQPTLLQGRWLQPSDRDAIVVNINVLKHEPDLALGSRITLTVGERSSSWQIVGVVTSHLLIYGDSNLDQGVGYIPDSAFVQQIYRAQRSNRLLVRTTQSDPQFRAQVGRALEAHFAQLGIQALVQTQNDIRSQISSFVGLIVALLLAMALSFVAIGALALIGAMSLNVIERTKEIGVLRSIGASHRHITGIVLIEGICIGLLSWLPATLLALPLSMLMSDVLGRSIVSWPLVYIFPITAPLLWMGVVALLSAGASYLPARRAAQINVRNALEYE